MPQAAWDGEGDSRCLVAELQVAPDASHGRVRVGDMAAALASAADATGLLSGEPAAPPLVFFDLETTGLNGGAGTYAFLIGCASFDATGALTIRQHLLATPGGEGAMLRHVKPMLGRAGALVSFNGKSFDATLLETRFLFHRLEWDPRRVPHLDVLHPGRRFWGGGAREADAGSSLGALERQVLGFERHRDVPGFEIPARYFHFLRSGDSRPLLPVLEHNRMDLLSLAGLCARLVALVAGGAEAARTGQEALALGRVFARAGRDAEACEACERALALASAGPNGGRVRVESLRMLAQLDRRAGRFSDAERRWRQLLAAPGCHASAAREALEALAVHHEHRARDLPAARAFALRTLEIAGAKGRMESARCRIARIDRKLARGSKPSAEAGERLAF